MPSILAAVVPLAIRQVGLGQEMQDGEPVLADTAVAGGG
jgi:hypothetical protein